jgi:hypothetical protein
MKFTYVSLFVIALVIMSGLPLISGGTINYANAKYATNTQSQANSNECDTGTNCAITSPQNQGDGTANSPTNLQISEFNEVEQEVGVIGPPNEDFIEVTNFVTCPFDTDCPRVDTFVMRVETNDGADIPTILDTKIFPMEANFSPSLGKANVPISSNVVIEVANLIVPPAPPGLHLVTTTTGDCNGFTAGGNKTCTINNDYQPVS